MPMQKLREFLDSHHVKYVVKIHSRAYTAQEVAAVVHIPGKQVAKTVMVLLDGQLAMCVLPASCEIDFSLLRVATGSHDAHLAHEEQFKYNFPDCEIGAMPPFGNLYDIPVYVAQSLADDEEIAFNACSHTEIIRMNLKDYMRLVSPTISHFTRHAVPAASMRTDPYAEE
jgi:Ala-tRNA(Pro) deacylase